VNSARTLADRFRTQRTDRIRVDGVEVLSLVEIDVEQEELVEVLIETARTDIDQALNIRSSLSDLVALSDSGQSPDDFDDDKGLGFELVTVQASQVHRVELACAETSPHSLQLWNSWVMGDSHHSWTGNSGIVAEELEVPPGASTRVRLWCSDGLGDPQFDDLVVVVTVGKVPAGLHAADSPSPVLGGLEEE
jgi:hypothetical protein